MCIVPALPCSWQTSLNDFSFFPDGHRYGLTILLTIIVQVITTSWSEMTQVETIFVPGTEKALWNKTQFLEAV